MLKLMMNDESGEEVNSDELTALVGVEVFIIIISAFIFSIAVFWAEGRSMYESIVDQLKSVVVGVSLASTIWPVLFFALWAAVTVGSWVGGAL